MKIVLERDQTSAGVISTRQVFSVKFRAEVSQEQKDAINKYKLADDILYQSHDVGGGSGIIGMVSRAYQKSKIKSINVRDLVNGKTIECDDVAEMLEVEAQVVEAATGLKNILDAAVTFGGRHIIEI